MSTYEKRHSFRIMVLISKQALSDKASAILKEMKVPVYYRLHAEGTVSSEMMDMLGLVDTDWNLVISLMPKNVADKAIKKFHRTLMLGTVNSGIVFTIPMNGTNGLIYHMLSNLENNYTTGKVDNMSSETKHSAIFAVVKQGYSDKVMDAARKVGARGGTVLHSRQVGEHDTLNAWGLNLQEETDMILIIADNKIKLDIMQAISKECGVETDANGLIFSAPIDTVLGISVPDEDEE